MVAIVSIPTVSRRRELKRTRVSNCQAKRQCPLIAPLALFELRRTPILSEIERFLSWQLSRSESRVNLIMTARVLVIGATGAMGRAVIKALLADERDERKNWSVKIFSRDPGSRRAQELLRDGGRRTDAVKGDLDDPASLRAAMDGAQAMFVNTDFFSSMSVRAEYEQGVRVLEAAQSVGVEQVVYSSLDAAVSLTDGAIPVPHYDAKAGVEHWIDMMRSDEFMRCDTAGYYSNCVSVLVTAPYFENFQSLFPPQSDGSGGLIFHFAGGGKPHPMIALADIGWFVAEILAHPEKWGGRTLRVLGDAPTLEEVASTFQKVTGIRTIWRDMPLELVRQRANYGHDLANMYAFFQVHGITRNLTNLRQIHPGLLTFETWLRQTGWRGEPREVQARIRAKVAPAT